MATAHAYIKVTPRQLSLPYFKDTSEYSVICPIKSGGKNKINAKHLSLSSEHPDVARQRHFTWNGDKKLEDPPPFYNFYLYLIWYGLYYISVIYYLLKSFQITGALITQAITMKIHQNQVSIQVANSTPMPIPPRTLAIIYSNA